MMILCADTARPPGPAMHHIALTATIMYPENHFRSPDVFSVPFGTKSASTIQVLLSHKLLHPIHYSFFMACILYAMISLLSSV
jgi:hypothetical protein